MKIYFKIDKNFIICISTATSKFGILEQIANLKSYNSLNVASKPPIPL